MGDKFDEMAKSLAISIVEMARVRSALTCELEHDEADCVTEATNDIAQAIRMAVEEERESKWQPIETAPTDEIEPFLVLLPGNDMCKTLAVQVSNFEGYMYPDCKDGIIDWEDHILGATHWQPLPAIRSRSQS